MSDAELQTAISALEKGRFLVGEDWEKAHQICQSHEGSPLFDWLHAIVHRIEGDDRNAGYWYQRAGKERHSGTVAEELTGIQAAISQR
jgi:hypothetical protein